MADHSGYQAVRLKYVRAVNAGLFLPTVLPRTNTNLLHYNFNLNFASQDQFQGYESRRLRLFSEIQTLLEQKQRVISLFENRFHAVQEDLQKLPEAQSRGFDKLADHCVRECNQLRDSTLKIVLYGNRGTGKSSLGNVLLGTDLLATSLHPMTSAVTMLKSGPVNPDQYIDEWQGELALTSSMVAEGANQALQSDEHKLSQLRQWLKDILAHDGAFVTPNKADLLKQLLALPSEIRRDPPIVHIEAQAELFKLKRKGVQICDCPGTKEAGMFSIMARLEAQTASVIVFVCNNHVSDLPEDKNISFLRSQLEMGARVIVVLNTWEAGDDVNEAEWKAKEARILKALLPTSTETAFQKDCLKSHILKVSPFSLEIDDKLAALINDILDALRFHMRSAISSFLKSMHDAATSCFNFSQMIISLHMRTQRQLHQFPVPPPPSLKMDIEKIDKLIRALDYEAKGRIGEMSADLDRKFREEVEAFRYEYLSSKLENIRIRTPFVPYQQSMAASFFSTPPDSLAKFRGEILQALQKRMSEHMLSKLKPYQYLKAVEFAKWVTLKTSEIRRLISEVQDEQMLVSSDRSKNVTKLFKAVDASIRSLNTKEIVAFGMSGGVVMAGAALAGIAVATLAAVAVASIGGIALLAGLIAYTGTKKSSRWQTGAKTDQEFRRTVLNDFTEDCKPSGTQYELFKASLMGNWSQYVSHLVNGLTIATTQLHSLTQLRSVILDDKRLESYIWIREELLRAEIELRDELKKLYTAETFTSPIISQIESLGLNNVCFTCGDQIVKCDHLCRSCDAILGSAGKCPFCNSNSIDRRIKSLFARVSPEFRTQVTQLLASVSLQPGEDFIPTTDTLRALLQTPLDLFSKWFETEIETMADPASVVAQFIVSALQKILPADQSLSKLEPLLQQAVWKLLFPSIKKCWYLFYQKKYAAMRDLWTERIALNAEELYVALTQYPEELRAAVFQQFEVSWKGAETPWEEAHCFRRILFDYQQYTKKAIKGGADDAWPLWEYAFTLCDVTELKALSGCIEALGDTQRDGFMSMLSATIARLEASTEEQRPPAAAAAAAQ